MEKSLKGCLVPDHEEEDIVSVCLNPKCKQKSRILCLDCLMEKTHQKCRFVTKLKQIQSPNYVIPEYPNSTLYKLQKSLLQSNDEKLAEVDQLMDNLLKKVTYEIQHMREHIKQEIMNTSTDSPDLSVIANELSEKLSLDPLRESLNYFRDQQISLEELNRRVQNFASQDFGDYGKKLCEKEVVQNSAKSLNYNYLKTQSQNLMNAFVNFEKQVFTNFKRSDIQFTSCKENAIKCDNDLGVVTGSQEYANHAFRSQSFSKTENLSFQFQVDDRSSQYLYIGVTTLQDTKSKCSFWYQQGPCFCLKIPNHQQNQPITSTKPQDFQNTGSKSLQEVYSKDQVYTVEIQPADNIFKVYDNSQECVIESSFKFDSQSTDDWVFVFAGYDFTFTLV